MNLNSKSFLIFCLFVFLILSACSKKDEIEKEPTLPPTEKPELPTEYNPGDANKIAKDVKLEVGS